MSSSSPSAHSPAATTPRTMRSSRTLAAIQACAPEDILIAHVHDAIVEEVRDCKNWDNGLTLFTDYLGPVILGHQKAAADSNKASSNGKRVPAKPTSQRVVDFAEDEAGQVHRTLSYRDIELSEPPVRDDRTIDRCLINLIYRYAQSKDVNERSKGLDLIHLALHRGVGLPTYNTYNAAKSSWQYQNKREEGILTSVSRPILNIHKLRISADGRTLEPNVPGTGPRSSAPSGSQPRRQQAPLRQPHQPQQPQQPQQLEQPEQPQQQVEQQPPREQGQRKQQEKQLEQRPSSDRADTASHKAPRDAGNSNQEVSRPQQTPPKHTESAKHQEQPSQTQLQPQPEPRHGPKSKKGHPRHKPSASTSGASGPKSSAYNKVPEDLDDQYSYYTKPSRAAFAGVDRNRDREAPRASRYGGGGGELRTIAFVPASTNAALKNNEGSLPQDTNEADVSGARPGDQDFTKDLVEKVERLQLEPQSDTD
ncbi:hypothetical protein BGZ70_002467 [Mortierella alpina]|uniref:Uncharacterized protein n=1 Tax=Mortierella alpina TaxID=64518 RepID=A0A9P6JEW1_MORAP|nr:hypothetical protein BGZ70_002467 [Mortierella alpina]